LRSNDWEQSIKEKLQVVTNTSKMIYDEISTKRGHLLELGIIILINTAGYGAVGGNSCLIKRAS